MSGYPPPGPAAGEEGLDNLWASLQESANRAPGPRLEPSYGYYNTGNTNYYPHPQGQGQHGYHQPFVSSVAPTPSVPGPQPHHSSAVMSPVETPQARPAAVGGQSNADRTSSLLSLLKFSQPAASANNQPPPIGTPMPLSRETSVSYPSNVGPPSGQGRSTSTSDLLATLMGNLQPKPAQQPSPQTQQSFTTTAKSPDTQAYLLNLLNKPKPPQNDVEPQLRQASILTPPSKASTPDDAADLAQSGEDSALDMSLMGSAATEDLPSFGKENVAPGAAKKLFTYKNPFDQLAATSPRNRTPKNGSTLSNVHTPPMQILKPPRQEQTESKNDNILSPPPARKIETSSQSSAPPTPLPDGRTKLEALIGIGAQKETVHQALHDVGPQADKEANEAIARAEREQSQASIEQDLRDLLSAHTDKEFKQAARVAAKDIKKELDKEENSNALDDLPPAVAEEVKEIIDETAQGHVADSWESADAEDSLAKEDEAQAVKVYNFPMRPWTSITIKDNDEPRPNFRDEVVMDIARLKKEFDQVDRTLVTASNAYIVYVMPRGGFRIIRQETGKDARLFTETNDRIFSVVISSSQADLKEAIIGTGVSGTVYWGSVKDGEEDFIDDGHLEQHGFALPPLQSHDIESPGGVLKTRARKSANHPEYFAVGRGKYIHIVWPSLILKNSLLKNGKDRIVDVDKYLSHQSLRINTGKAGKDFAFSDDDTVIASLDKAGKVKFWDIRGLTQLDKPSPTNVEIKDPLLTFVTTPASEKSWPTSVLFVDKSRPYLRGGALRYLIVGMKQNHTLQLWDLALGKPVQDINLPHSKESDAVCSVMYHPGTGMIVVGHPTRNSIYFLHLSAPKYNLPKSITQAQYIEKLVANDPSIPKPESTAVISGMREYSFANKGSLRSLDILQKSNSIAIDGEPITLFELYSMHSKGVTCINIKQADLGWTTESKVINAVVADKAGVISIDTLKEIPVPTSSESADPAPPPYTATPTRIATRPTSKDPAPRESPKKAQPAVPAKVDDKVEKKDVSQANGAPPASEKKKRRKAATSSASEAPVSGQSGSEKAQTKPVVLDPSSHTRNGNLSKGGLNAIAESPPSRVSQDLNDDTLKKVTGEVKKLFNESMESLYQSIKIDKRTEKNVSDAKQDAMLRLVSETLTDNIQITLGQIINRGIQETVVPAVTDVTSKAINDQLSSQVSSQISKDVPKELQRVLPDAVSKALQQPQLLKLMSESLAKSVAFKVEEHFAAILQTTVTPAFTKLTIDTSRKVAIEVQRQASAQIGALEQQRQADASKIEQLTQLVTGLTETVSSMAAAQSEFQAQFLKLQQQAAVDRRQTSLEGDRSGTRGSRESAPAAPVKTTEEVEFENMLEVISRAMQAGDYENAVIQWLQTRREQEFFVRYFSNFSPDFIQGLSPLLLLSLGATMSMDLTGELLNQKIDWLETIILSFQAHLNAGQVDAQVRELIPKIMNIYIQRLEHLFMRISQISQDPILKRISIMVANANRILDSTHDGNGGGLHRR